ncbi:MAG: DUF1837 domain-containing protein [Methanomicrobia archaeon]|nr:DUF1837 domain-containing protein [Methanomicrobia archaeon]
MAAKDIEGDEKFIERALSVRKHNLPKFIEKVCNHDGDNILCEYFMIACSSDNILDKEFIRELRNYIISYALKRGEYSDPMTSQDAPTIVFKAVDRFVKDSGTGEPGELILFVLLESQRNAPQILNKMSLKTSGNIHFHGLDGIHIGIRGDEINLYYGESKIEKSMDNAIKNAIDALNDFHMSGNKEEHELDLISNYIDEKKFEGHVDEIKEIINPYSTYKKEKLKKVYSVFIGFNWSDLIDLNFRTIQNNIKRPLTMSLSKNKQIVHKKCRDRIVKSDIDNSVEFFFLPFKDVQKIREYFIEEVLNRERI